MLTKDEAAKLPAGETRKRACITDAKSALRWFKQHAGEFGMDPARIITGGGSAGGHISALATLNPGLNDPADPVGFDTSVVAYLWFNPAFAPDDSKDAEVDVLRFCGRTSRPPSRFTARRTPGCPAGTRRTRGCARWATRPRSSISPPASRTDSSTATRGKAPHSSQRTAFWSGSDC